jgi:L-ribulose-5-phosphate 4-epimerase
MKKNITDLSERTLFQNIKLIELGLVVDTFGNASSKTTNTVIIKPSGILLSEMKLGHMSVLEYDNCKLKSGKLPSSDTPTHFELYRNFDEIGGITHTHSLYATAWAQAAVPIPCFGTTHADYWKGEIPVTRDLTVDEINGEYELETGKVIVEKIIELRIDPLDCPGILVAHHGPFTWGRTVEEAVKNAERLEYIAKLAWMTLQMKPQILPISTELHHRHFSRKHGPEAYYGQENS